MPHQPTQSLHLKALEDEMKKEMSYLSQSTIVKKAKSKKDFFQVYYHEGNFYLHPLNISKQKMINDFLAGDTCVSSTSTLTLNINLFSFI